MIWLSHLRRAAHFMADRQPLHLHIPTPRARPGSDATFDHLLIAEAGSVARPAPDAAESGLRELPFQMIRVLDSVGRAVGPWNPHLNADHLRAGLTAMLLTRLFDERMFRAQRQGKTTFYISSTGEEAIGAAQSLALDANDMCFPTYRVVSWLMARRYPLYKLMCQIFSNAEDPLKGRQLPVLYSAREYGFYSLSGNVGSRFGHAVGWAMASAYKGDTKIALGYIGEGTTAEGDFHEALTFASVYHAPVILCITNNQWAISSYQGIAGGEETTFAAKAIGYGIPGLRVDANDFLAIHATTAWAAQRARSNLGATLIELVTYRAAGHSTSDDPGKYRPTNEALQWPLGDPIDRLKQHLIGVKEWSEEKHAELTNSLTDMVKEASKAAESVGVLGKSKPGVEEMFNGVFKEPDWRVLEQRRELGV